MHRWRRALGAALWSIASSVLAYPAQAGQGSVVLYTGGPDRQTLCPFLEELADRIDQVVGFRMQIEIDDTKDGPRIWLSEDDPAVLFLFCPVEGEGGGIQLTLHDAQRQHGFQVVDGFAILKNAGLYQGILAIDARPVDEAVVRLAPGVSIEERPVE